MKYYIRQIKPYVQPPCLPGFNCSAYPVEGYDWVLEDLEDELSKEIVVNDSMSELIFRERFIEAQYGKWIYSRAEDEICVVYRCFCCEYEHIVESYADLNFPDYCPHCGAKMDA